MVIGLLEEEPAQLFTSMISRVGFWSKVVRLLRENVWWSRRVFGLQIFKVLGVIGSFLGGHPFQQRPCVRRLLLQKSGL